MICSICGKEIPEPSLPNDLQTLRERLTEQLSFLEERREQERNETLRAFMETLYIYGGN